jgi:hypothetical protein
VGVQEDLDIPVLHVVFEGDGNEWKAKGNQHEDKVVVMCEETARETLEAVE